MSANNNKLFLLLSCLAALATLVLTAALPPSNDDSVCTQPRIRSTNCSEEEMVRMFHFSSLQNRCRGYMTCPLSINDTDSLLSTSTSDNLFATRAECNESCPATQCLSPPLISNGDYMKVYINHQTVLRYSCGEGYELKGGSAERVCGYDGDWSGIQPQCKRIQCPLPPVPVNGSYHQTTINNLTVLQYSCATGYTLVGPSERSCTLNGSWIGEDPHCIDSSKVTCPDPEEMPNALRHKVCSDAQRPGCFVMYTCKRQYRLVLGNFWRVCNSNGRWSGNAPVCGRVVITYGDKEVTNEVKTTKGDKNVQIKCKMEPSFPSQAHVEWSRGSNVTWIENKTAYALQFDVVTLKDDGDYTCSITISGGTYESRRRISVRVLSTDSSPPAYTIHPSYLTTVTSHKIILNGFFRGEPKPTINWYNGTQLMTNSSRISIVDLVHSNDKFTFSRLEITNISPYDYVTYKCEAINTAGVIAYDVTVNATPSQFGLTKRKRRRRSIHGNNNLINEDNDFPSFCTSQNTIVFIGECHHNSDHINEQSSIIDISISRIIPSLSSPPLTDLNNNNHMISAILPPRVRQESYPYLKSGKSSLFITRKLTTGNGQSQYVVTRIFPENLESSFRYLCSSVV